MKLLAQYLRPFLLLAATVATLMGCETAEVRATTPESNRQSSTGITPPDATTLRKGEIMYIRCRSCHSTEKDGPHLSGPNLNGLFGANAGTKNGFQFSSALSSSEIVWNAATLDEWIESPSTFVPANMMVFAGLPNSDDRAALIAYLAEMTK